MSALNRTSIRPASVVKINNQEVKVLRVIADLEDGMAGFTYVDALGNKHDEFIEAITEITRF